MKETIVIVLIVRIKRSNAYNKKYNFCVRILLKSVNKKNKDIYRCKEN